IYEAHDAYWGGRPPVKHIRFVEVPEVSSRVNGLLSGEYHLASDIPPDQIEGIEKNAAIEVPLQAGRNAGAACPERVEDRLAIDG
ncbi:ABC transporter substrate-binding protein, partial [Rhizobium johnstonii]|uniref:ABC transporter substrate-binding protein n=1 Tax=Rhizobium johnstonii TaxID=3019933 RepID=UPI003F9B4D48